VRGEKNLTLMVYDRVKEMMFNYDIIPGQRLVFVDLARQLNVSRTPVNNALSILAKEGFLDFVPNQGYSVHRLTRQEAESLYEVREILELGTIGKSIRFQTPEKLRALEAQMDAYEQSISDRVHRKLFIIDTAFHEHIIRMTDNTYLAEQYREVCQKIFLRFRTDDLRMNRIREIVAEHREIFKAIQSSDVQWAKELMQSHNRRAKENLFSLIFQEK